MCHPCSPIGYGYITQRKRELLCHTLLIDGPEKTLNTKEGNMNAAYAYSVLTAVPILLC